jgi:hypothetical protein
MFSRGRRLAALAAAGLLLAACDPVQAQPESSKQVGSVESTAKTSAPQTQGKAPSIANPIAADQFVAEPCASLTAAQLTEIGAASGQVNNSDSGSACDWKVGVSTVVRIGYLESKTGLGNLYTLNDSDTWKDGYFEPLELQGYPAAYVSDSDGRLAGVCVLSVGIASKVVFTITATGRAGDDSCATAKTVASDVLTTIRG